MYTLFIFCLFNLFASYDSANILGIWYHGGKSHHILGEVLLKELARRGHNVTMASAFPLKKPFPNYTDIHLTGILEDQKSREDQFMKMNQGHNLIGVPDILSLTRAQTELTLNHTEMDKLVKSGTKFDVIIMDWFMNTATLVYGPIFDAPIIPIASHGTTYLANVAVGNPCPPSYIPNVMFAFPYNMTFFQRVINGVVSGIFNVAAVGNINYHLDLVHKYYGNEYTFEQLMDSIALVLTNGHYSYESPRPFVPNIIPVGGFHIQQPSKLSNDLQQFMDNSKQGVIYFSLGSNMKSVLLPKEKQQAILKVFSKLPQNVLWKWEGDTFQEKPSNVLIDKWFPQNEILAHPNTKLFVSHGGLLSTIEAIYYGVPVLGIPIFGDQRNNILTAVNNGYALKLELFELDEETFGSAIREILNNPRYKETVKKRSILLRDRPQSAMDTAVFWVEHVIRNKGAPHLKNAGIYLNWYQYFLLDVILFVLVCLLSIIYMFYFIIKIIWRLIFKKKNCKKTKVH